MGRCGRCNGWPRRCEPVAHGEPNHRHGQQLGPHNMVRGVKYFSFRLRAGLVCPSRRGHLRLERKRQCKSGAPAMPYRASPRARRPL